MAYDFPNNPTDGQQTGDGRWVYDATEGRWLSTPPDNYVLKTGDTMTGALTINVPPTGPNPSLDLQVSGDAAINGLTVGRGAGNNDSTTAVGQFALSGNTTGVGNTAVGQSALSSNTIASNNTAVGRFALLNNTEGGSNTAVGWNALEGNTIGAENTAIGRNALFSNTEGGSNTAVGRSALQANTTGSGNFGAAFLDSSGSYTPVFNPITQSNRVVMGHTGVTNAYIQVAWTITSDARDKTQIAPLNRGLDFVNQLNPVSFKFRKERGSEETNGNKKFGFLAQEVLAIEGDDPVIVDAEISEKLNVTPDHIVPVLVKALQEATALIKDLQARVTMLESKL